MGLLTQHAAAESGIACATMLTQVQKQAMAVVRERRRVDVERLEMGRYRRIPDYGWW
jgi:hypothetical protein